MRALSLGLLGLLPLLVACSDRARRNPLDPGAGGEVADVAGELSALAADQQVLLRWDYRYFVDVAGYVLYRRRGGDAYVRLTEPPLGRTATAWVDRDVVNGQGYEYRLGLLIDGEPERALEPTAAATPGPEVVWAADRASGLVWKVAPDGRNAAFSTGRFGALEGADVDPVDGSVWVVDRDAWALYQIGLDGSLRRWAVDVEAPGQLRIDGPTRRVWLVDRGRGEVRWFDPPPDGTPPQLEVVDAHFAAPSLLAPQDGGCWIGDTQAARVLYVHPAGQRLAFADLNELAALAAAPSASLWALLDRGYRLVRLGPATQRGDFVDLDFQATDLAVDGRSGRLWVVGDGQVALLATSGAVLDRWEAPAGAGSIALDAVHRTVWVAGTSQLWKLDMDGEQLASLRGFAGILRVALAPALAAAAPVDTPP
jgi:hypothetical protein